MSMIAVTNHFSSDWSCDRCDIGTVAAGIVDDDQDIAALHDDGQLSPSV